MSEKTVNSNELLQKAREVCFPAAKDPNESGTIPSDFPVEFLDPETIELLEMQQTNQSMTMEKLYDIQQLW